MSCFADDVVLITGAGSGIGRATARRFAAAGARVVLAGRTLAKLEQAMDGADSTRWIARAVHHERRSEAEACVAAAVDEFGRLDILVNNAGEYVAGTAAEASEESWQRALDVNLTGPFTMTRAALPRLREAAEDGRTRAIVNVASTLALEPIAGALPYCVSKAGLVMLTRATALEEAPHGVRAVCVAPGVVDTPIHTARAGGSAEAAAEFLAQMAEAHPLGRIGRPEEVADLVLFLASEASAWTTGAVIPIDGGISLA